MSSNLAIPTSINGEFAYLDKFSSDAGVHMGCKVRIFLHLLPRLITGEVEKRFTVDEVKVE